MATLGRKGILQLHVARLERLEATQVPNTLRRRTGDRAIILCPWSPRIVSTMASTALGGVLALDTQKASGAMPSQARQGLESDNGHIGALWVTRFIRRRFHRRALLPPCGKTVDLILYEKKGHLFAANFAKAADRSPRNDGSMTAQTNAAPPSRNEATSAVGVGHQMPSP